MCAITFCAAFWIPGPSRTAVSAVRNTARSVRNKERLSCPVVTAQRKREILPDPKFGDRDLTKFMNYIMVDGKKSVAERIIYGALEIVEEKAKREPVRRVS